MKINTTTTTTTFNEISIGEAFIDKFGVIYIKTTTAFVYENHSETTEMNCVSAESGVLCRIPPDEEVLAIQTELRVINPPDFGLIVDHNLESALVSRDDC